MRARWGWLAASAVALLLWPRKAPGEDSDDWFLSEDDDRNEPEQVGHRYVFLPGGGVVRDLGLEPEEVDRLWDEMPNATYEERLAVGAKIAAMKADGSLLDVWNQRLTSVDGIGSNGRVKWRVSDEQD